MTAAITVQDVNVDAGLEAAAEGKPMHAIAAAFGCSHRHLNRLVEKHHEFGQALARAREIGLRLQADKLMTMVRDNPDMDVQRLKLEADNIKWLIARLIPHVFGDRLDVNVTERLDVNIAIASMEKRRAQRLHSDLAQIADAEVIDLPVLPVARETDNSSVADPFSE